MRYIFIILCFLTTQIGAATYEIDLEELFPNQSIFKSITINAEILEIDWNSDNTALALSSPKAELVLLSQGGKEWAWSINDLSLQLQRQPEVIFKLNLDLDGQQLYLSYFDNEVHQLGYWRLQSQLYGENSLLFMIANEVHKVGQSLEFSTPKNSLEEVFKGVISQFSTLLHLTAPIFEWNGAGIAVEGQFVYDDDTLNMQNIVLLDSSESDWSARIETRSYFSSNEWGHEITVPNPSQNIRKISMWVQENCLDQLSEMTGCPSISYYGTYFPVYFADSFTALLLKIGEPQNDGTILFTISGGVSTDINGVDFLALGNQLLQMIKDAMSRWW